MSEKQEKTKRRLWVITELYYPEETSTGYYLTRIAEGLADDFEVGVVCGQPNYSARGVRAPARERRRGVDIHRARGTTLDKNSIPKRIVNMLTLGMSVLLTSLRVFRRGDLVLVVTTPPSLPFVAAAAALVRGASYVLLVHDNYPEILVAVGKSRPDSAAVRIANRLNRWLYKHAARIIAVGRDMRELLERKTAGLDAAIDVIPNWAELEQVEPAPRETNPLIAELGIADRLILLYAGNMGHPNDIESIVECVERLSGDPRFFFVFLGSGAKRAWLERELARIGGGNAALLDPRPREEQRVFLNACDVGIVTLVSRMLGVSMPSRTYNLLAAGKPLLAIAESGSEVDLVVADDAVGWTTPPGDADALLATLERIWTERGGLTEMGGRARRAALERYSVETAIDAYRRSLGGPR